ncbi:MAG: PEP-CTERM sorting domain-containing protein [Luteolibacter sp.]
MKNATTTIGILLAWIGLFTEAGFAQTSVADGIADWTALTETSIAYPGAAFGSIAFPNSGISTYTFSFNNEWLVAEGRQVDAQWAGAVAASIKSNATSPATFSQSSGSRLTEGNDFNPGVFPTNSGMYYETIGRGNFTYGYGGSGGTSDWTMHLDFSGLSQGWLPAGTLLSFIDVGDGIYETLMLSGTLVGGGSGEWMEEIDYSVLSGAKDQQTPYYAGSSTYTVGMAPAGPVLATKSAEYVLMRTTVNLTDLTVTGTQGSGSGTYGMKIMAPIPEPAIVWLFSVALSGWCVRRKR